MSIDAMKQALEALEKFAKGETSGIPVSALTYGLRTAIADAEKQEPVAVVDANDDGYWADILPDRDVKVGQFLYAAQPALEQPDDVWNVIKSLEPLLAAKNQSWALAEKMLLGILGKQAEPEAPAPQPAQRQPLTDEDIGRLTADPRWADMETPGLLTFARAIEAAHGIKENT